MRKQGNTNYYEKEEITSVVESFIQAVKKREDNFDKPSIAEEHTWMYRFLCPGFGEADRLLKIFKEHRNAITFEIKPNIEVIRKDRLKKGLPEQLMIKITGVDDKSDDYMLPTIYFEKQNGLWKVVV